MKELKASYEEKLKQLRAELQVCPLDIEQETKLETKINCYKTFIAELDVELKKG